jgi:quinol monooxygenase YgiN
LTPAPIVIVADLWVREDRVDRLLEVMEGVVDQTHAREPGVKKFAFHRDSEDPLHFVMIEAFANEPSLQEHRETDYYRALMAELPDLLVERKRTVLTPTGFGDPERGHLA